MILECSNQSAIIGVSGALLGVILGFILNQAVRMGRIKVFVNTINRAILNKDENGNPYVTDSIEPNSESVTIYLNLDFYNTSSFKRKIGRDFFVIFRTTKGYKKLEMSDKLGGKLKIINLEPNELVNRNLQVCLDNELEIYKDFDFYLEYKNSKNRTIRKRINIKDDSKHHREKGI